MPTKRAPPHYLFPLFSSASAGAFASINIPTERLFTFSDETRSSSQNCEAFAKACQMAGSYDAVGLASEFRDLPEKNLVVYGALLQCPCLFFNRSLSSSTAFIHTVNGKVVASDLQPANCACASCPPATGVRAERSRR